MAHAVLTLVVACTLLTSCAGTKTGAPDAGTGGPSDAAGGTPDAATGGTPDAGTGGTPDTALTGAMSWPLELVLSLNYQPLPISEVPDDSFPRQVTVAAVLSIGSGGAGTLAVGGHGQAVTVPLSRSADGGWHFLAPDPTGGDDRRTTFEFTVAQTGPHPCTYANHLNLTGLDLRFIGSPANGMLTGAGAGFVSYSHTDYVGTRAFFAEAKAAPDPTAPSAVVWPGQTGINPFDGIVLDFAETLTVMGARLESGTTTIELVGNPAAAPSLFAVPRRLLPFGQTLRLAGILVDGAGHNAGPVQVTTMPDLPAVARSTFEDVALPAGATGDVALVSAAEISGVTGARALFIGPGTYEAGRAAYSGARYTAQLTVPAGATRVRAALAVLSDEGNSSSFELRLAAPRGDLVTMQGPTTGPDTVAINYPRFPRRGPWIAFETPLPPGTAGTVYVDIENRPSGCGPGLRPSALVVDELRAE
jgi:hypothetical protein